MLSTKTLILASAVAVTTIHAIELDVYEVSADWLGGDDDILAQIDQKRGRRGRGGRGRGGGGGGGGGGGAGADADGGGAGAGGGGGGNRNRNRNRTPRNEVEGGRFLNGDDGEGQGTNGNGRRIDGPEDDGFFNLPAWQSQTRQEKLDQLWDQIVPNESAFVDPQPLYWKEFPQQFEMNMNRPFRSGDDFQRLRLKIAHTQGLHAKVTWNPVAGNRFTGMYETGSDTAILRISETAMLHELSPGLLPSMAIKFFIDGRESENLLAMPSFESTSSWNFFDAPLKSRVEPFTNQCEIRTIEKKLAEGSKSVFSNGVGQISDLHASGETVSNANTPYQLNFDSPLKDAFSESPNHFDVPWYDTIRDGVSEGDTIFNVYAVTPGAADEHIADVIMQSLFYTSVFGDTRLYFQHRKVGQFDQPLWGENKREWFRLEDRVDNRIRGRVFNNIPNTWPTNSDAQAKEFFVDQVREFNCPFAWLIPDFFSGGVDDE